ncbi:uncharacterized protein [Nicotiana tomentosiformis]|uniref:uncharacterized protein n=1 Tax=Nicotiana tomentosiformis TaxID=4098 RepID=UPI00388CB5E5
MFGDIFKQLAIREDIVRVKEMLFEEELTSANRIVLQQAQAELKKYLSIEEQYWKQKARMNWFAEGDRNTRFFHKHVNGKRQKLNLKKIQGADSNWLETQELMANVALEFYSNQFTQTGDTTNYAMLNNIPTMVTLEQNLELCKYPTIDEVKDAIFALSGDSAGGPDGFIGLFYQT